MAILYSIILIHFLAQLTPGPDLLLISRVAMTQGKMAAVATVFGISIGIAVWIILTLTGFSLVLARWPWLQSIIMLFGAIFLAKMGLAMIQSYRSYKAKSEQHQQAEVISASSPQSYWRLFSQGLLTNLANPKAIIYFASVFSLAVNSKELQNLKFLLGLAVTIETFLVFIFIAWGLSHPKLKPYYQKNEHYIDGIAGLLFVLFAVFLLIDAIKGFLLF